MKSVALKWLIRISAFLDPISKNLAVSGRCRRRAPAPKAGDAVKGTIWNAWPFQPWLMLGLAPFLAFLYAAIDSSGFGDGLLSRGQTIGRDFAIFWSASVLLWRGDAIVLFDPAHFQLALEEIMGMKLALMPYPYPPNSVFFLAPLALLPYMAALPLWLASGFTLVAAILRHAGMSGWIIAVLLVSPSSIVNICSGQNGFLSAALLCGGFLLLEKRPGLAGVLIGLLSYKPQLGLILPLLLIAGGHWRCFLTASTTVVLLVGGSIALLGTSAWHSYFEASAPQHLFVLEHGNGFFQQMSPTFFMGARLAGLAPAFAWALQAAVSILVAAASIWAFRQKVPHELKAAIAMIATFLVTPYALTYDMTIVAVAILLIPSCFRLTWWEQGICLTAWLLPALVIFIAAPIGPPVIGATFLMLQRRVILARWSAQSVS